MNYAILGQFLDVPIHYISVGLIICSTIHSISPKCEKKSGAYQIYRLQYHYHGSFILNPTTNTIAIAQSNTITMHDSKPQSQASPRQFMSFAFSLFTSFMFGSVILLGLALYFHSDSVVDMAHGVRSELIKKIPNRSKRRSRQYASSLSLL